MHTMCACMYEAAHQMEESWLDIADCLQVPCSFTITSIQSAILLCVPSRFMCTLMPYLHASSHNTEATTITV